MSNVHTIKQHAIKNINSELEDIDLVLSIKEEFNFVYEENNLSELFIPFISSKIPTLDISIIINSKRFTLETLTNILCTHIFVSSIYPTYKTDGKLRITLVEESIVPLDTKVILDNDMLEFSTDIETDEEKVILPTIKHLLDIYKSSTVRSDDILEWIKVNISKEKLKSFSFDTNMELKSHEMVLLSSKDEIVDIRPALTSSDIIVTDTKIISKDNDVIVLNFGDVLSYSTQYYLIDYLFGERYAKEILKQDSLLQELDYTSDIEKAVAYVNTFGEIPDVISPSDFHEKASKLLAEDDAKFCTSYEIQNALMLNLFNSNEVENK